MYCVCFYFNTDIFCERKMSKQHRKQRVYDKNINSSPKIEKLSYKGEKSYLQLENSSIYQS